MAVWLLPRVLARGQQSSPQLADALLWIRLSSPRAEETIASLSETFNTHLCHAPISLVPAPRVPISPVQRAC